METTGVFRCEGDFEMNGRYSFKSLLLDGEGMDEVGLSGAHQLVLNGDLDGGEDPLYRDDVMGGRESFKSLLLDGENMQEDEIEFSQGNQQVGNDNHLQNSALPPVAPAVGVGIQEVESVPTESPGFDCVNQHPVGYVDQEVGDFVEMAQVEVTKPPSRKRRRGKSSTLAVERERNVSEMSLDHFMDDGYNAVHGSRSGLQPQPSSSMPSLQFLSSLPQVQPLPKMPPPKKKKEQIVITQPPARKRKQGATSSDVQRLLDSVIARQEMFFTDLLESMERKEAIRERIRDEKEEKWRAEERAQLGVFNNAMLVLTQELLSDSKNGTQSSDKAK
ncbi:unnamed protein product [Calypogeia fissa]